MATRRILGVVLGLSVATLGVSITPVSGTPSKSQPKRALGLLSSKGSMGFTPAAADPKLAAILANSRIETRTLRFTPVTSSGKLSRNVTVAVRTRTPALTTPRARTAAVALVNRTITPDAGAAIAPVAINPMSYDLGVSLGWKRFAVSGDIARANTGSLEGRRQRADVGVSFTNKKWTTRVGIAAERPVGRPPVTASKDESVAVDFGGSYRLSKRIDLTAGVRYKAERENRLDRLADTQKQRDSQAVYLGTQFKF
jgi:hypothetical protein